MSEYVLKSSFEDSQKKIAVADVYNSNKYHCQANKAKLNQEIFSCMYNSKKMSLCIDDLNTKYVILILLHLVGYSGN